MGEENDGEIEKKIEATLPRAEHVVNPRVRKASHYMRIFNQGNENASEKFKHAKSPLAIKEAVQSQEKSRCRL